MAAGTLIKQKRKAGAFVAGELAAGEIGVDTTNGDLYFSKEGTTVTQIDVSAVGGGSSVVKETITQASHGFVAGDALKFASSVWAKAQADSAANAEVVGVVESSVDANNFVVVYSGRITGLSGLTANTTYFLSAATAGLLTSTEPSTAGQISKPLLVATSTTAGIVMNMRGFGIVTPATPGKVAQVVTATSSTAASTTTGIPQDDTVPQNTEGAEYLTASITPTNASSTLIIEFQAWGSAGAQLMTAFFVDSTADAIHAAAHTSNGVGYPVLITERHILSAGSTSARTYKVRFGPGGSGSAYMLNYNGVNLFSSSGRKATLTIQEILP